MDKLKQIDVRGIAHDLIKSNLYEQKQRVITDKTFSDFINTAGVPQGIVLGHLLFLICNNNILESCSYGEI